MAAMAELPTAVSLHEFVLARITDHEALWAAYRETATTDAEVYCCNDAAAKLKAQRILTERGLGLEAMAKQHADHADYSEVWAA